MKFGFHLPDSGRLAGRDAMHQVAIRAEELGFDSLFSSDHIAWPDPATLASRYPYSDVGDFIPTDVPWLDCIGSLLFCAGCTERIALGSTVAILGYRPPIQQAKLWATLDAVAPGRVILGVGVGWMREEFETLGVPFDRRGARADETLEIFRCLFRDATPRFEGPFTRFGPVGFEPKPKGGEIPIWVGGHSPGAYRRAARFGHAWHAAFADPDGVREQWEGVRAACDAAARNPAELELTALVGVAFDRDADQRGWIGGSSDAVTEALRAYAEHGVSHVVCWCTGPLSARLEAMERLQREVRPHC